MQKTLALRKQIRNDFIVADPFEENWLYDLRRGGQVLWGGIYHVIYGKKRKILEDYTALARQGKWEEAYALSETLEPARELMNRLFSEILARTASYATPIANIKAWYEALGLKAGPMLPPIRNLSEAEKEKIKEDVIKAGLV